VKGGLGYGGGAKTCGGSEGWMLRWKELIKGYFRVAPVKSLTLLNISIIICLLFSRKDIHKYKFGALEMHSKNSLNVIQVKRLVFHSQ